MDQNTAALVPLLPGCFGWNLARTKCLAGLIIALIKVRTVNFAQLATALPGGALKDSKYKHIQRLFRTFPLDFSTVARFIASQLPEGQYLLTLDRTNWKFGQTHINILCLAIPVLSILSDKTGNSNTDERIPLINRFIELFPRGMVTRVKTDPNQESSPSGHQYFQVWFRLAERDFIQNNGKA